MVLALALRDFYLGLSPRYCGGGVGGEERDYHAGAMCHPVGYTLASLALKEPTFRDTATGFPMK